MLTVKECCRVPLVTSRCRQHAVPSSDAQKAGCCRLGILTLRISLCNFKIVLNDTTVLVPSFPQLCFVFFFGRSVQPQRVVLKNHMYQFNFLEALVGSK